MDTGTIPSAGLAPHQVHVDGELARPGWTPWRVISFVLGSLLVVTGLVFAGGGVTLAVAQQTTRDADGFLMNDGRTFTSDTFAITSGDVQVHSNTAPGWLPDGLLGDVRLTASSSTGSGLFLGGARTRDAAAYLGGVRHDTLVEVRSGHAVYETSEGTAPDAPPTTSSLWVASAAGQHPRLTWEVQDGDWTVVLMRADGAAPVDAIVSTGAQVPVLNTLLATLLGLAVILLVLGGVLVVLPSRRLARAGPGAGR